MPTLLISDSGGSAASLRTSITLALVLFDQILLAQRCLAELVGDNHGPAASGPLLELAREVVDEGARGAALERDLEPPILYAHEADIGLERSLDEEIALLACERDELGKARDPARRLGLRIAQRLRRLRSGGDFCARARRGGVARRSGRDRG